MILQDRASGRHPREPWGLVSVLCLPIPVSLAEVVVLSWLLIHSVLEEGRGRDKREEKRGQGRSHLQPLEKSCDLLADEASVADGSGVMVVSQGDPFCQPHIHWLGQVRLQCGYHLPDPVFQYAVHLRVGPQYHQPPGERGGSPGQAPSFFLLTSSLLQLWAHSGSFSPRERA